jgi:hypothetical protein
MMVFANLLFGFFKTHAGSEAGDADERRALSTFASACVLMNVQANICKNIRWHLQDSVLSLFGNRRREISMIRQLRLRQL